MTRVLVETAATCGRPVHKILRDPYALTLWTWADVQRQKQEASVRRMGERTDAAGLTAVAFHDPAKLQQAELRYLKAAGALSQMVATRKARAEAMVTKINAALAANAPSEA